MNGISYSRETIIKTERKKEALKHSLITPYHPVDIYLLML
uniref:Uncharacterized protein n=1 Tax=virus sp. ctBM815 TaxID=2825806 RepID=A0A8S5RJC6_9VIRU|nr:MAG TPA: hypothetical protein [virus sp. ctBM815]